MKRIISYIGVAILGLVIWIAVDYMFVKSGQDLESIWYSSWINVAVFLVAPTGFYILNYNALSEQSVIVRHILSLLISCALAGLWFLVAFFIVANFHLSIGGSL